MDKLILTYSYTEIQKINENSQKNQNMMNITNIIIGK